MSDAALNSIRLNPTPVRTIAGKDIRDALRDRFILIVTAFLGLAAPVSYTHLDVYKRQADNCCISTASWLFRSDLRILVLALSILTASSPGSTGLSK